MSPNNQAYNHPPERVGYAVLDQHLRLSQLSPSFQALLAGVQQGNRADDVLPILIGMDEEIIDIMLGRAPSWHITGAANELPGQETRFFDVTLLPHHQEKQVLLIVRDVSPIMLNAQKRIQRRNETDMQRHEQFRRGEIDDFAESVDLLDLETNTIVAVCSQLNLMFLLTDQDFMIEDATADFAAFFGHSLVQCSLIDVIPAFLGVEVELHAIVTGEALPWRLPGLQITETPAQVFDVLVITRPDKPGLIVAARQMDVETSIEQMLRQQHNELILLQDKLLAQASVLRTTNDRLESLDRERRALMTMIVYDIRSSLSVVSGYSEWLKSNLNVRPDSQKSIAIETIMKSVQRMSALVSDVYLMEDIEQRLSNMSWATVSLQPLLASAVSMWRDVAGMLGVELQLVSGDVGFEVEGDTLLLDECLKSILDALIRNASDGAIIMIRLFSWDRWAVIRFENESVVENPSLHNPSPKSHSHEKTRIGLLDLVVARLIAEGHGGHLSVQDDVGQPLKVSLWLLIKGLKDSRQPLLSATDQLIVEHENVTADEKPPTTHLIIAGSGSIRLNTSSRRVWVNDEAVYLTANEYTLLLFLVKKIDMIVTHDELIDATWPTNGEVSIDSLRVLVWRLRQKLDRHTGKQYLRTVRGFGYMLIS
ncbi:MAG: hypothetical protein GY759_03460 [Chloroflexi bacterium]|nr:hypothetical protein [Chloroflexota bacterium]